MIDNFKACKINRGTCKLAQTSTLIKRKFHKAFYKGLIHKKNEKHMLENLRNRSE